MIARIHDIVGAKALLPRLVLKEQVVDQIAPNGPWRRRGAAGDGGLAIIAVVDLSNDGAIFAKARTPPG